VFSGRYQAIVAVPLFPNRSLLSSSHAGTVACRESDCLKECVANFLPDSVAVLLGLLFHLHDGGDMFLRNFGLSPNYTALDSEGPTFHTRFLHNLSSNLYIRCKKVNYPCDRPCRPIGF
jgi:hypothetical protein